MSTEFVVAYEITRSFEAVELEHDPPPDEVMDILIRQVEHALSTVVHTTFRRLESEDPRGNRWVQHSDGLEVPGG